MNDRRRYSDLRQKVEHGDEQVGAAEVTDHRVHAAELLSAGDGHQHAENEPVAAECHHEDDRLDADLSAYQCLVSTYHCWQHGGVGVIRRPSCRQRPVPLHLSSKTDSPRRIDDRRDRPV